MNESLTAEQLAVQFRTAIAALSRPCGTDAAIFTDANKFLIELTKSAKCINLMIWLLDEPQFKLLHYWELDIHSSVFLILTYWARAIHEAPLLKGGRATEAHKSAIRESKKFVENNIFRNDYGLTTLVLNSYQLSAKLQQIMGELYVIHSPSSWSLFNGIVTEHYKKPHSNVNLGSFFAGALFELCELISADGSSKSAWVAKKIDKTERSKRISDVSEMMKLIWYRLNEDVELGNDVMYLNTANLLSEFIQLITSTQQTNLIGNWISLEFFYHPRVYKCNAALLITHAFHKIVTNLMGNNKSKKNRLISILPRKIEETLTGQILNVIVAYTRDYVSKTSTDQISPESITTMDRIINCLYNLISKEDHSVNNSDSTLFVMLVCAHHPHPRITKTTLNCLIELLAANPTACQLLSVKMIIKALLYRCLRSNNSTTGNLIDVLVTDAATKSYAALGLSYQSEQPWSSLVTEAQETYDEAEESTRSLGVSYHADFRIMLASLFAMESVYTTVHEVASCVIQEWLGHPDILRVQNANYPIVPTKSHKNQGYSNPCYTVVDAIGTICQAACESKLPHAITFADQIIFDLITADLTWIDSSVAMDLKGNISINTSQGFAHFGSHWYWIEARRMAIIKICNSATLFCRRKLLPFLLKRLSLDLPPEWQHSFPKNERDTEDAFYSIRHDANHALKAVYAAALSNNIFGITDEIKPVVEFVIRRLNMVSDGLEQHTLVESLLGLTSATGDCQTSKQALSGYILQLFSNCRATLDSIVDDAVAFTRFVADPINIKACCQRRRQLTRELTSLDTIATSLILPPTWESAVAGGYIKPVSKSVDVSRQRLLASYPLKFKMLHLIPADCLNVELDAPQVLFIEVLLPLIVKLLQRIADFYNEACPSNCTCSFPQRCACLQLIPEEEISQVQQIMKEDLSKLIVLVGQKRAELEPASMALVNIRSVGFATVKLLSTLIKLQHSFDLYGYIRYNSEHSLINQIGLQQQIFKTFVVILQSNVPTSFKSAIVRSLLHFGIFNNFVATGLPTKAEELMPVLVDPYCLVLPTPETVVYHIQIFNYAFVSGSMAAIAHDCCKLWQQMSIASSVHLTPRDNLLREIYRMRVSNYVSEVVGLLTVFLESTNPLTLKLKPDESDMFRMDRDLSISKYTLNALRAVCHEMMVRESFGHQTAVQDMLETIVCMMAIPSVSVNGYCQAAMRNFVRFAWKRVLPSISGIKSKESVETIKTFLDSMSHMFEFLVRNLTGIVLIVFAPFRYLEDLNALEGTTTQPLAISPLLSAAIPPTMLRHLMSEASSSSALQYYRLLSSSSDSTFSVSWSSEETNHYSSCILTIIETIKGAVHLFSSRCSLLVLRKPYTNNSTMMQVMSALNHDPVFKDLVLTMTNPSFPFHFDDQTCAAWVGELMDHKESRQVREDVKSFVLNNLQKIFAPNGVLCPEIEAVLRNKKQVCTCLTELSLRGF